MSSGLGRRLVGSLALGIVVAVVVTVLAVFVLGRPPHRFSIASGAEGGMYERFAADLRAALARRGFELRIIETAGSIENAELLRERQADIGLVQSGTEALTDIGAATALAEVFYEPIWVFARNDTGAATPTDLDGLRLGIGPEGSGTNALARRLMELAGIDAVPVAMATTDAVDALRSGELDAAVFVVAPNAPIIAELAAIPGLHLLGIDRTDAIARHLPYLTAVTLPEGVIDVEAGIPPYDVPMLAARATLMARPGLHPDLARLVVQEVRAAIPPALIGDPQAYPSLSGTQLPVNEDARKFLVEGPTPLEGFLPFEVASPLSRIYLVLLPLLVLIFPVWTLIRAGWVSYTRGRISNWYPRLVAIERGIDTADLLKLEQDRDFLTALATQLATRTRVPGIYGAAHFDLRADVEFVTRKVDARMAELRADGMDGDAATPGDRDRAGPVDQAVG